MKEFVTALILTLVFGSTLQSKNKPEYPITLRVGNAYETKIALQASPLSQRCRTNCYSGELECLTKEARNFQVAQGSDNNTYELRCEPGSYHGVTSVCPIGPGSYEARRDNDSFRVRVPGEAIERTLVILNSRPTAVDDSGAPQHSGTTISDDQAAYWESMDKRGDVAMGFSHEKTSHHFRLTNNGGYIQVQANDAKDTVSVDQIHQHLTHIATAFAQGDFSAPMLTHGGTLPGVPTMQRLKSSISYTYEPIDRGGRVRIATTNATALAAVHKFLRFQIEDHQTRDPIKSDNRCRSAR